jgi:glutamine synthetase
MASLAEYIWVDGAKPSPGLRSKARVVNVTKNNAKLSDFPEWGFDGSSTYQAPGNNSDLALKPVYFLPDPIRGGDNFLVLCEVAHPDGTPHSTNSRALLREILDAGAAKLEPMVGFEQEYTFFMDGYPLGFPADGEPEPQGPYYCGVGSTKVFGREVVEVHAKLAIEAGLNLYGINAEVMPGQWEYQVGYRGFDGDVNDLLTMCDQRLIANWLLERVAEDFGITVSFENKPQEGDWNGAGCHTNFSTNEMRNKATGKAAIDAGVKALEAKHYEHVSVYGANNDKRLTGKHETCSIHQFRSGAADRGASIRLPLSVAQKGYGYLEDRRPGANADPYVVSARLLVTIANMSAFENRFEPFVNLVLEKKLA